MFVILPEYIRGKDPLYTEVYIPKSITNDPIKSVAWKYQDVSGTAFIYLLLSARVFTLDWHLDNCLIGTHSIVTTQKCNNASA